MGLDARRVLVGAWVVGSLAIVVSGTVGSSPPSTPSRGPSSPAVRPYAHSVPVRSPDPTPSPSRTSAADACAAGRHRLTERLESELAGENVSVAVHERLTGYDYDYDADDVFETASVAKVSLLVTLLTQAQHEDRPLTAGEQDLARRAIEYSDNDAADGLWSDVGGAGPVSDVLHDLHLKHTEVLDALGWGLTRTTARDQVRLLSALTGDVGDLSAGRRAYALDLMSHVAPEQAWGVSAAAAYPGDDVALKNGWLNRTTDGGRWIINSIGRVQTGGHDFLIAVMSNHHVSSAAGIPVVERAARTTARALDACLPLPVPPRKPAP